MINSNAQMLKCSNAHKKTPYLKFNKSQLEKNYEIFHKTCQKYFGKNFQICFSTKTNTNPLTLKTLAKINSGFEVASLREIRLTPKKSFRVMNGPAKTEEELKQTIKENVLIFIDSFSELSKIQSLNPTRPGGWDKENSKIKIRGRTVDALLGIRLGNNETKFGFTKEQFKDAFKKINPIAIQLHGATSQKMKDFKENLKTNYKIIKPYLKKIKYLNFGGGYPDNFQLKNLGLSLDDYIKEIKETFKEFKGIFIFEPGRNLVADAYTLITKVIVIKEKGETSFAILDAGINILSKITLAQFKFNKLTSNSQTPKLTNSQTYTLAGPLLFNNDIVGKWHGKLSEGDLFEVENVGAYCENLAWNIIYDKPKVR